MERYSQFAYDNERNIKSYQNEVSLTVKIAIAEAMPNVSRGRTSEPNPLEAIIAKMIEDGKPRHIIADDEAELKQVLSNLRRGFHSRGLALKLRKDVENGYGIYVHFGAIMKRTRKPKAEAAPTA